MSTREEVRAELVRSRGFIRGAETQLTKALAALDAMELPGVPEEPDPPVEEPPAEEPEPPLPDPDPPVDPQPVPAGVAAILGPLVPLGVSPWPWFDEALVRAQSTSSDVTHVEHFLTNRKQESYYYDLGQVLYIRAQMSGDPQHLADARAVTDAWIESMVLTHPVGDVAPRSVALGSVMVRALEGRGDEVLTFADGSRRTLWDWAAAWARRHNGSWIKPTRETLYYGLRDGGYVLLYTAQLAMVHPDAVVREEMRALALTAAVDYFARLQYPDGGWYWGDSGTTNFPKPDGTGYFKHAQPFMVGLLLDGMVAAHQLTGDERILASILRACEWLAEVFRVDSITLKDGTAQPWRAHWYFVCEPGAVMTPETKGLEDRGRIVSGSTALAGGWDTNTIRSARQMVPETVHAFGYAYQQTGDARFRAWGDEHFAACFGNGAGPLADRFYCLNDYLAKQYNQAYRTSGRYLAWRA